jgi:sterol desaturase/sphingolipid hydroxylase (fatty acid hydroxylase superfamily)
MLAPILVTQKYIQLKKFQDTEDTILQMLQNSLFTISIISVIIFALANIILPFINKRLIQGSSNIKNLLI